MTSRQAPPCPNCGKDVLLEDHASLWVVCLRPSKCVHCGRSYQLESDEVYDGEDDIIYFRWEEVLTQETAKGE